MVLGTLQPGTPESRVTADFMLESALQAEKFGYSEDKAHDYVRARGVIAMLATEKHGVQHAEEITEEMVEELALLTSPTLQGKIREEAEERRRLKRAVLVDPLTGVASRAAYDQAIAAADRDTDTKIVMFDGDNVGQVNKKSGHTKAGDQVIKDLADHISKVTEKYGLRERVFRFGGDEFVVLANQAVAKKLMREVVNTYGKKFNGKQKYGSTTVSITGAVGKTSKKADKKLIKAKRAKKAKISKK